MLGKWRILVAIKDGVQEYTYVDVLTISVYPRNSEFGMLQ